MKCIIIEDQPPAQRILTKYIEDFGSLQLVATFSDAISAMDFLQYNSVDLMFLDIHLPKMSGIDFLETLHRPPQVILTTAFSDYALESYEFNVVDYLLKPFSFQRFVKAIAKVKNQTAASNNANKVKDVKPKELFIKVGHELVKIRVANIIYINSDTDYTELFLEGKKYLSSESLKYWEETLDNNEFIRVHKSYIVNTSKIEKISGGQLVLSDNITIPIGRVYKDRLMQWMK